MKLKTLKGFMQGHTAGFYSKKNNVIYYVCLEVYI
jgi:hypothetical protein